MLVLQGRNVNELWARGLDTLVRLGVTEDSRNGLVRVLPTPVMSVYERPQERVLFDPARDANPFFHLFESLWMLAGREDAQFLNRFVGDFGKRFAEDDGRLHGAYGYRWRHGFGMDQLDAVVDKLRNNPSDRQAVIQMWDALTNSEEEDCGYNDLLGDWKDRPCNTHIYLRVRRSTAVEQQERLESMGVGPAIRYKDLSEGEKRIVTETASERVLDLTVCCRSNDIIWGAYGANAVHFSVLQEYLAGRIGVEVGKLYQFSNNWHAYELVLRECLEKVRYNDTAHRYADPSMTPMRMGTVWDKWDADLERFLEWAESAATVNELEWMAGQQYENVWFKEVAEPMFQAHGSWKRRTTNSDQMALAVVEHKVKAADWREAAKGWLSRRMYK